MSSKKTKNTKTNNKGDGYRVVSDNRQARYLYEILETYEAGIQLVGTEVKSIKAGKVNLQDGYALIKNGEAWLLNAHISPYNASGQYFNHEPRRNRKLLLHRQELRKLIGKVEQQGLTLVPLKMYLKNVDFRQKRVLLAPFAPVFGHGRRRLSQAS